MVIVGHIANAPSPSVINAATFILWHPPDVSIEAGDPYDLTPATTPGNRTL